MPRIMPNDSIRPRSSVLMPELGRFRHVPDTVEVRLQLAEYGRRAEEQRDGSRPGSLQPRCRSDESGCGPRKVAGPALAIRRSHCQPYARPLHPINHNLV